VLTWVEIENHNLDFEDLKPVLNRLWCDNDRSQWNWRQIMDVN
jgi:hypothetical protein